MLCFYLSSSNIALNKTHLTEEKKSQLHFSVLKGVKISGRMPQLFHNKSLDIYIPNLLFVQKRETLVSV